MTEDYWLSNDGAGNMAGVINRCAANFMKIVPQAHHYHCASHILNLTLSTAYKVPEALCYIL